MSSQCQVEADWPSRESTSGEIYQHQTGEVAGITKLCRSGVTNLYNRYVKAIQLRVELITDDKESSDFKLSPWQKVEQCCRED